MVKVEKITKRWPRAEVRCSATISDPNKPYRDLWPKTRGDYQCQRVAHVIIDGAMFCKLHGGVVLIEYGILPIKRSKM